MYYFIRRKRYYYIRDKKVINCKGFKTEKSAAAEEISSSESTSTASEPSNPRISDSSKIIPEFILPALKEDQKAALDHKNQDKATIHKDLPRNTDQKRKDLKYGHSPAKMYTGLKKLTSLSRLKPMFNLKVYNKYIKKAPSSHIQPK